MSRKKGPSELTPRLAQLLDAIERTESLSASCEMLGTSYRYEWGQLKKAEMSYSRPLVKSDTGGKGGGKTSLTAYGKQLLSSYRLKSGAIEALTDNEDFWQVISVKLSARNQIPGKIVKIEKDGVAAKIVIEVTSPVTVTSMITSDAAEFLKLKVGMEVKAVVKATEVMVMA